MINVKQHAYNLLRLLVPLRLRSQHDRVLELRRKRRPHKESSGGADGGQERSESESESCESLDSEPLAEDGGVGADSVVEGNVGDWTSAGGGDCRRRGAGEIGDDVEGNPRGFRGSERGFAGVLSVRKPRWRRN